MSDIEVTEEEIPGVKAVGTFVALAPEGDNHGLVFVLLEDGSVRWRLAQAATEPEDEHEGAIADRIDAYLFEDDNYE